MKKAISILLAVIFAISLMPFALADSTATITAYNSADVKVGETYATIDAAAAAAGQGGKVCITAGVLEVNGRQTISVSGVTLEGAGRGATIIKPSASFASASETNRKAILTIAANNVTVKDLSLDGTDYGSTLDMGGLFSFKDFVILRVNSGTGVQLNNVYITGSPKTLLHLGNGSTAVFVTASELYCQGMAKTINLTATYADIDFANSDSRLTVTSGALHAFISDIGENSCMIGENCEPVFTLEHSVLFQPSEYLHSTFQHFANMYVEMKDDLTIFTGSYAKDLANPNNQTTISDMVDRAEEVAASDPDSVGNFVILLNDAADEASGDYAQTLRDYADGLSALLAANA